MSHSNPSPGNPNTVVVRPDLMSSEAELRDVLPHYTGHLAPSLQQAVTQQLLDEAQNRRITKGDLPSLISALILRLFRPESASEGFNWDSGDQSSTHSLPMHSSSSTHCLSRPLSSSPRSSHDALSQQHPSRHWHSDYQHPTAPAAAAGAAYLPYPPIAIPAPVGPPLRDSPRSSLRRARVTAMQEALMKHSNFQGHGQQQQQEQQHGRSMASPAHKMNPAESLRRSRTFMEVMKTASAANSTSSSSGISDTVEGPYRGHDRSSSSSNFAGSASTGNSPVPAAKPRLPVHTRTRSPDELPFKMPKHWPAQTHSPLARAPPHTQASSTALHPNLELPGELPTIPGPLGSLQVASTTPTASSSPKSWESPAPPATPSPPVIRTPSPPPAPPQSTRARSPPSPSSMEPTQTAAPPPPPPTTTTRPTHRPHFPGEATSVEAARAPSSGLTRASSGSFDQRSLDEFKGLGPRNSSGSDLCSPLTLVASDIDGSNKEGKDKQRAGRKSVGFALQASDGSFTSRDSPCTSPGPSSTPVSPCSTPLLSQSCRKASALKGRGSVGDGGTGQGDGTPLRRCVSFAVPQSMASDDGDDDDGDGQAKPCRPLASRHRSSEPGRSSRRSRRHHHQCRHQHEGGGREAFEEGDRGSGRHRCAHRASDTGFAQGQGPRQTEAERCSRGRDASRPSSRRHSTPTEGGDAEQGRSLTSNATGGSLSISMELSKRKSSGISQHGHIEGGMQGDVQPQQDVLLTKTEHDANTASTAAAAAGDGDGAPRQQPVSTSAASCRQGVREAGGGVTSGTGQGSEGGGSDDSSNSEEDVSKAVAKLLRKRYPALALPLLQVVESRCKPEELLMLAAAPVRSQQQSLDATVQGALTSLMEENSVLRSRVRELESLTRSSNSSSSNSSGALGRYVRPATQSRFWAKTRSLGREDPPAGPRFQPAHSAPYSAPVALRSSGKLMPWCKRHSELLSEVVTGPGSTSNNSEHSSEAFSELTLRPVQLKRSARNSVHTASTRSGSLSQSQSLCSNRSLSHRWSSSVRSSIRSRSSARSRATTSDSKQEDEEHHGPDMERMGHDEIAAVAAASFRARGSCALEGLDQGPTSMDERRNEGRRSLPEVPQHPQAGRSDGGQAEGITMGGEHHHRLSQGGNNNVPGLRSEMTPYGLQALHERVSSASGSNGNEGGTAGSTRSSKQHHSEIQQHSEIQAAGADTRGVQEIEEETACEGQGGQLPSAQQQGTPNEQRAVQNDQQVAKQPVSSPQAGQPQCCAIQ